MNICYISNEYPPNIIGGVGIYMKEITQAVSKSGHNVFVITQAPDNKGRQYKDGKVMVFEVPYKPVLFFRFLRDCLPKTIQRLEYGLITSRKLKDIIKTYHIDVVESPESWMGGFWYYLFRNKPPLLIKLHTPEGIIFKWNGGMNPDDIRFVNILEKFWMAKANLLIGVTNAITELVTNYYGLNLNSNLVVPNPVASGFLEHQKGAGVNNSRFNILYAGRLEFRKGVHVLVKAIPKVLGKFPDARFVFVGADCGMKSYIKNKIKEYDCRKNVEIINQVSRENLICYYNEASLCVVPSLWENFPYACIEPMSLGKLVVASNTGGIPEIITDNETGILFTPGSSAELAKKIIQFLPDNDFKKDIQDKARKHIKHLCNPADIANRMIDIYQKLIKC